MTNHSQKSQIVYTNKAHCRDCYRCLRVCPVKAIRMEAGQAYVVPELCISCGTCIRECPQGAKTFRNDVERAVRLIAGSGPVAASIAPSFVAVYSKWEQKRLPSALRKLGFSYVGETAIGAYHVARETQRLCELQKDRSHVCTACPAVVNYVERYEPEKVELLVPVVSPMLAHARYIRERFTSTTAPFVALRQAQDDSGAGLDQDDSGAGLDCSPVKVVFIGPCVAKKAEADRPENAGLVDCALTFVELEEWMEREGVDLSACEESHFDEEPEGDARFFPLVGGSVRIASMDTDLLAADVVSASGFEEVCDALAGAASGSVPVVIEPLFCPQGCVNGPAIFGTENVYQRRRAVLDYASENAGLEPKEAAYSSLSTRYRPTPCSNKDVTEEQIREVYERTGKSAPENQLNCGACGYPTCRDKAIAVIKGMAEPEMCIPYMKRLAEQRTDRIIETSPNGIVILDEHLNIISMNPAFRNFFMCSEAVCGRPISYLMDPDPFEKLASGKQDLINTVITHSSYNLVCHEILYALREEKQYAGIFVNITKDKTSEKKLDQLRAQTVVQARELLDHQIRMAQTIASFLGESTAQGEALLEKLMLLAGDENEGQSEAKHGKEWLWDIYTSK